MRTGPPLILCVDDDQDLLDSMQVLLGKAGYAVETATCVEAAVARYKAKAPDLVVVDLMMEEADSGLTFVKRIQQLGPTPPVYLLSAVGADLSSMTEFSKMGLTDVLQKPVDPATLIRLIQAKLGKA